MVRVIFDVRIRLSLDSPDGSGEVCADDIHCNSWVQNRPSSPRRLPADSAAHGVVVSVTFSSFFWSSTRKTCIVFRFGIKMHSNETMGPHKLIFISYKLYLLVSIIRSYFRLIPGIHQCFLIFALLLGKQTFYTLFAQFKNVKHVLCT